MPPLAIALHGLKSELVVSYGRRIVPITSQIADRWGQCRTLNPFTPER